MENPFTGYVVTSEYGSRTNPLNGAKEFHRGIDLVKADRSPIYAFSGGIVRHAKMGASGSGFGRYGHVVAVQDPDGALHVYAHLNSISVQVNQQIAHGAQVGTQGRTGDATGSHLHYEVRLKASPSFGFGTDTNPTNYLLAHVVPQPTLRQGSRGQAVTQLQTLLKVNADGVFGPKTEAALKAWQKANHLVADGIYGPKSYQKMQSLH